MGAPRLQPAQYPGCEPAGHAPSSARCPVAQHSMPVGSKRAEGGPWVGTIPLEPGRGLLALGGDRQADKEARPLPQNQTQNHQASRPPVGVPHPPAAAK